MCNSASMLVPANAKLDMKGKIITSSAIITVVCLVLIDKHGAFLATQRPADKHLGLCWEFPGGKVEEGELTEDALRREIQEELGIEIGELTPLPAVEHTYEFGSIRLLPLKSICDSPPTLTLAEHVDARWVSATDWPSLNWAPADVPVIMNLLKDGGCL